MSPSSAYHAVSQVDLEESARSLSQARSLLLVTSCFNFAFALFAVSVAWAEVWDTGFPGEPEIVVTLYTLALAPHIATACASRVPIWSHAMAMTSLALVIALIPAMSFSVMGAMLMLPAFVLAVSAGIVFASRWESFGKAVLLGLLLAVVSLPTLYFAIIGTFALLA